MKLTKVNGPVFRKIAMGSWNTVGDPSVYGTIDIEMTEALKFIEDLQKKSDVKISVSHLVGKAVANVLKSRPEINGLIRFHRIYQRESVDVFYQVNIPGSGIDRVKKANLAGALVRGAENLNVIELAQALTRKSQLVRESKDEEVGKALRTLRYVPWFLIKAALNISSFLTYDLNLNLSFLGIPADPFGSVMITNVGSLGIEQAWAPLVPYTRVPLLLTLGAIKEVPWVEQGEVVVRPVMKIGITFDHRLIDGFHAAEMSMQFRKCFEDPWTHLG